MPGKNFRPRITPEETAAVADAAVGRLARRLTLQLLEEDPPAPKGAPAQALTLLYVLDQLQQAAERLQ
ncbi:response regulator, partial [Streptomyces sp. NPDC057052]